MNVVAHEAETYRFSKQKTRGFTLTLDGVPMNGMITVDFNNIDQSIVDGLFKWNNDYSYTVEDPTADPVEYKGSVTKQKFFRPARKKGTIHGGSFYSLGPDRASDELIEAMRLAIKALI